MHAEGVHKSVVNNRVAAWNPTWGTLQCAQMATFLIFFYLLLLTLSSTKYCPSNAPFCASVCWHQNQLWTSFRWNPSCIWLSFHTNHLSTLTNLKLSRSFFWSSSGPLRTGRAAGRRQGEESTGHRLPQALLQEAQPGRDGQGCQLGYSIRQKLQVWHIWSLFLACKNFDIYLLSDVFSALFHEKIKQQKLRLKKITKFWWKTCEDCKQKKSHEVLTCFCLEIWHMHMAENWQLWLTVWMPFLCTVQCIYYYGRPHPFQIRWENGECLESPFCLNPHSMVQYHAKTAGSGQATLTCDVILRDIIR